MKLLIASNNAHKIREIREILSGVFPEICSLNDAGLSIDVVEDGDTFEANAVKKAETVLRESGWDAALADDSGLCVDALGGAPGATVPDWGPQARRPSEWAEEPPGGAWLGRF